MRGGVVLGLAATGCSLVLVRTPDPVPPGEMPACTSSRGLPIVDVFIGVGLTGLAFATYFGTDDPNGEVDLRGVGMAAVLAVAVPFFLSAHHGVRATGTCRRQEAAFARYQAEYERERARPAEHLGRAGEACWPDGTCDPGLSCNAERRCDMQRGP